MNAIAVKKIEENRFELKHISQQIKNGLKENGTVTITEYLHLDGLASGLRHGMVHIKGSVGDYIGVLNSGAKIIIEGDVGNYLADNMISGEVIVKGNAGYCAAPYCYGGTVVIFGNCGDFLGTMNKGATILIKKNAGNDIGTYMLAGDIVLLENAGERLGNFLIRGRIFIRGNWKSLGHNTKIKDLKSEDMDFLHHLLSSYKIKARAEEFTKLVPETDKPFYSKKS
ncbi:MAG: hypothetical protein ACFFDT_12685 [Candidatus Hodarchaeota archaeon]